MIHVCQLRFCCCVASRWGAKPMESYGLRHQLIRHWQFLGKTLPGWKTVPTFWRCQLLSGSVAPNLHPPLKDEKHGIFASLMDSANFNAMFFMPLLLPPAGRIARNLRLPISPCSLSLSDLRFRFWRRQVRRMWVVNSCEAFQETRVLVCRTCADLMLISPADPMHLQTKASAGGSPRAWQWWSSRMANRVQERRFYRRSFADRWSRFSVVYGRSMVGLWLVYDWWNGWKAMNSVLERAWQIWQAVPARCARQMGHTAPSFTRRMVTIGSMPGGMPSGMPGDMKHEFRKAFWWHPVQMPWKLCFGFYQVRLRL